MAMAGADIESFNIGGPGKGGLSNVPGATMQEARDETWDWSYYGSLSFWVFALLFVVDWLVYRSDKKAND